MIIINNHQTNYLICTSKDASATIRFAASELMMYLYKSTGTLIGLHSDKCEKRSKEIYIGLARDMNYLDHDLLDASSEAFFIKRINDDDLLFYAKSDRGVLYSVYYFLEKMINLKCYHKDEIDYDQKDIIEFKEDVFFDFKFEYRDVYFRDAFDGCFASMNMLNGSMADLSSKLGGKTSWFNFHHSFSDLVDPKIYFNDHPEYFSLIDGKRRGIHTELCLSNNDVFNIALNKVKEWIKNNPECTVFSVSQDEWMGHFIKMACECPECKKIDDYENSQSGSIIHFVNRIADAIKKDYPDKLIHTFAYQYSRKAPLHIKPKDNVIVRLCNIECSWNDGIEESIKNGNENNISFYNDLLAWSKITNRLYIWDYSTNFRNYLLPFPNIRAMIKNIELYKKMGIKGILMQGNFSYGGKGYLDELKAYLISRYLKYDNLNLDEEIKDFLAHYYGNYQDVIYKYLNLFEDEVINHSLWLYDDSDSPLFNDEIIKKASSIIDEGDKIKDIDKYQERYSIFRLNYEYLILSRLDLDYPNRDQLIDNFFDKITKYQITEVFERTELTYSKKVMKESKYCKERKDRINMYYIMK